MRIPITVLTVSQKGDEILSQHSYSRCWLHLIWGTLNREKLLHQGARKKVSAFLSQYAHSKGICMRLNFVNADHVHALIDLPTHYTIEEVVKLLKGATSHWINQNRIVEQRFAWGRGYGVFSVSQSNVAKVARYIAQQEEHHRKKTFLEEYKNFISAYGMQSREEENR
jgi:putative transposase